MFVGDRISGLEIHVVRRRVQTKPRRADSEDRDDERQRRHERFQVRDPNQGAHRPGAGHLRCG